VAGDAARAAAALREKGDLVLHEAGVRPMTPAEKAMAGVRARSKRPRLHPPPAVAAAAATSPHEWHFGGLGSGKTAHAVHGQPGAVFVHDAHVADRWDLCWAAYADEPTVVYYSPSQARERRPGWARDLLGPEAFEVRDAAGAVRRIRPPRVLVVAMHHPYQQFADAAQYREALQRLGGVFRWARPQPLGAPTAVRVACGDHDLDSLSDLTEEAAATTASTSGGARTAPTPIHTPARSSELEEPQRWRSRSEPVGGGLLP
jgi:hypothetical protein